MKHAIANPNRFCDGSDCEVKAVKEYLTKCLNLHREARAALVYYVEKLRPGKWVNARACYGNGWFKVEEISGWRGGHAISPGDVIRSEQGDVKIEYIVLECRVNILVDASGTSRVPVPFCVLGDEYYNIKDGMYQLLCHQQTELIPHVVSVKVASVIGTLFFFALYNN